MFSASHVDGSQMPKEVAQQLIEVLRPGVEKMMRDDYSEQTAVAKRPAGILGGGGRGGGSYGQGGDSKRFRRN